MVAANIFKNMRNRLSYSHTSVLKVIQDGFKKCLKLLCFQVLRLKQLAVDRVNVVDDVEAVAPLCLLEPVFQLYHGRLYGQSHLLTIAFGDADVPARSVFILRGLPVAEVREHTVCLRRRYQDNFLFEACPGLFVADLKHKRGFEILNLLELPRVAQLDMPPKGLLVTLYLHTAAAALPFSASAAENAVNMIGIQDEMRNNVGETDANCTFEIKDGALTVTVGSENTTGQAECYIMAETFDQSVFNFESMPNLYWDVSGNAKWDLWIRCNNVEGSDDDAGLIKLSKLSGSPDGVEAGKVSVNLYEAINNDDILTMSDATNTTLRVVKYVVYGQPGDSVTINSLYFAAEEQSEVPVNSGSGSTSEATSSDASTSGTASKAPTSSSQVETGESVLPIIGITALAVVASSAVIVSAKKRK